MEDLNVVDDINHAGNWLILNQKLLLSYIINCISVIIILILGLFLAKIISKGVKKLLIKRHIDNTVAGFIAALAKYITITLTFIASLGKIGVQTTSVITILGAAGMAICLALQSSLSNFAAGVLLVTLRPLRTGEYVELGAISGTVLNVHIFYTMLKTLDGKIAVIPNGKIIAGNIVNYSRESLRRNEFSIPVSHQVDIDFIIQIFDNVLKNEKRVLQDQGVTIGLSEIGPTSLIFIIRCWSKNDELNSVYWDLMYEFKKSLDKNNIQIAPHKININIKKKISTVPQP
ncbi:small-conductance mechanosensitive channel MscS [Buchnera aphidicola (Mollitrichosiphum nigrofasciatum)]|uniref:small-conductance mechanosensitive channel MscS n=1 Tax=Buchnera aphidicola TaxID=9 RepID=UPI0031B87192